MMKVFGTREGFILGGIVGILAFLATGSPTDFFAGITLGFVTGFLMDVLGVLLGCVAYVFMNKKA